MKTLNHLFETSVGKYTDNVCILEKKTTEYEGYTYKQFRREVHEFAAGLMVLGIKKGDRMALMSEGRKNWPVAELGILYAGGVNVPLSTKLEELSEIKFRLEHSDTRMIVVSGNQAKKFKELKHQIQTLEKVIHMDPPDRPDEKDLLFDDIKKMGQEFLEKNHDQFEERWLSVQPDDYANICYTSGTTADPKGIILSHKNYYANVEQSRSTMPVPEWYTTLLSLPWDHAFAHTAGIYTIISAGASIAAVQLGKNYIETLKNFRTNIKEIKPVFFLSVPALAKNFKKNIEANIREKGKFINKLFNHALKISYSYNGIGWDKGKGMQILKKPLLALYDRIMFKKIREEGFGGSLRFFVGGGALLDIDLQRFFYAIGIPMFQGYGLTEAAPVISANSEARHKLGSSGYLVTDLELKICDEDGNAMPVGEKGEIVVKGENVMVGYWKNEEATREVLKDGWLYTGDMGYMDKDGFLYVLGRFKCLLIADDGEKFSPEGVEEDMTIHCSFVDQCMMHNNQQPYSVILVVPNKEEMKRWLGNQNMSLETEEGKKLALKELEQQMGQYRKGGKYDDRFPQRWLPAAIGIIPEPFTEENQLLNSTLKMVRGKISDKYKELLEFLYTSEAKDITNEKNLKSLNQ
jgi:long-chain acyl-CoA synthetase